MNNIMSKMILLGMGIALITQNASAMEDFWSLHPGIFSDQKKLCATVHNDPLLILDLSDVSDEYEEFGPIIMSWEKREVVGEKRQATTDLSDQPSPKRKKINTTEDLAIKDKLKRSRETFITGEEFNAFKILVELIRLPNLSDDQKAWVMFEMAHQSVLTYNKKQYFKQILELRELSKTNEVKARGRLEKFKAKN